VKKQKKKKSVGSIHGRAKSLLIFLEKAIKRYSPSHEWKISFESISTEKEKSLGAHGFKND
jgi:hypothetical protein